MSGGAAFHPATGSIRQKDAELHVEFAGRLPTDAERLSNVGAIFRMYQAQEVRDGEMTGIGGQPEDIGRFSRQRYLPV